MDASWLTDADRADLEAVAYSGFATLATVFPAYASSVILSRWDPEAEDWLALDSQDAIIKLATTSEKALSEAGAVGTAMDGTITIPVPATIAVGDVFSWDTGDGIHPARVVTVAPERLGLVTAKWRWVEELTANG